MKKLYLLLLSLTLYCSGFSQNEEIRIVVLPFNTNSTPELMGKELAGSMEAALSRKAIFLEKNAGKVIDIRAEVTRYFHIYDTTTIFPPELKAANYVLYGEIFPGSIQARLLNMQTNERRTVEEIFNYRKGLEKKTKTNLALKITELLNARLLDPYSSGKVIISAASSKKVDSIYNREGLLGSLNRPIEMAVSEKGYFEFSIDTYNPREIYLDKKIINRLKVGKRWGQYQIKRKPFNLELMGAISSSLDQQSPLLNTSLQVYLHSGFSVGFTSQWTTLHHEYLYNSLEGIEPRIITDDTNAFSHGFSLEWQRYISPIQGTIFLRGDVFLFDSKGFGGYLGFSLKDLDPLNFYIGYQQLNSSYDQLEFNPYGQPNTTIVEGTFDIYLLGISINLYR